MIAISLVETFNEYLLERVKNTTHFRIFTYPILAAFLMAVSGTPAIAIDGESGCVLQDGGSCDDGPSTKEDHGDKWEKPAEKEPEQESVSKAEKLAANAEKARARADKLESKAKKAAKNAKKKASKAEKAAANAAKKAKKAEKKQNDKTKAAAEKAAKNAKKAANRAKKAAKNAKKKANKANKADKRADRLENKAEKAASAEESD